MSLLTATLVVDWMYRGSDYALLVVIKENGIVKNITGYNGKLRLALSSSFAASLVQINGNVLDAPNGLIEFVFVPSNTKDLLACAHDITIFLVHSTTGEIIPTVQQRFGIVAFNPPMTRGSIAVVKIKTEGEGTV